MILAVLAMLLTNAATLTAPTPAAATAIGPRRATGNAASSGPSVSADGRYVAFISDASDLVAGDTNNGTDVFVRDLQRGTTERVSVTSAGAQTAGRSFGPVISADGRYVAFYSEAPGLVAGDTNDFADVFVRDRRLGTTEMVSVNTAEVPSDAYSYVPSMSADGRYVVFQSFATNLAPGDDSDDTVDIFLRDRLLGTTERVSMNTAGAKGNNHSFSPTVSDDGRFVAFYSHATNLVPGDTNTRGDIFVRDRRLATTERASVSSTGAQAPPDQLEAFLPARISGNGRYVAFVSTAPNLVPDDTNNRQDIFVRDRQLATTERPSVGTGGAQSDDYSFDPSIDGSGRFVSFQAGGSHLVDGEPGHPPQGIFRHDRTAGRTVRISVNNDGIPANGDSFETATSRTGRYVAFTSWATNLTADDTNDIFDVFWRDTQLGTTTMVSAAMAGNG